MMKFVEVKPWNAEYSTFVFKNSNFDFPFNVRAKNLEKAKLKLKLNIRDAEFEDD